MNFNFYSIFYVIIIQIIIFVNSENFNECRRNCEEILSPKKCIYEFNVSRLNHINNDCGDSEVNNCNKKWFGINGKSPGPSIEICLGDSLEIIVHNKLKTEEVTFHWHGINQRNSAHMDGVSMITQCPILPFTSYRYHIVPEYTGTFYYHTHSVLQEGDGLYGSLIVRGPQELLALEKIIMISSRSSSPLSSLAQSQPPTPTVLTINGENKNVEFQVNKENKLRLINANVFNCPVAFSIAKHSMSIVGADGRTIEPVKSASKIIIFPGERMDVKIITKTPAGKYKIYIQGIYECKNLIYEGTLSYHNDESVETIIQEDENYYLEIPNDSFKGHDCNRLGSGVVCSMDLTSSSNEIDEKSEEIFATYYIPFDVNSYNHIDDKMTDYSFNIYEFSYYPSYLTTNNGDVKIPQINHVTFKYPPSPILSQYHSIPDDIFCSLTEKSKSCDYNRDFCECLQIFEVPPNKIIDIILINEGFGSNTSHVFHLHGYTAKILGVKSFNNPITKDEIINLDNAGKLEKNNNNNPLLKDTFVVPNKGYTIIRLSTNNLGYWLWESRVTGTSPDTTGPTMEILMRVGTLENLPTVPIDFPTCGNHRGPDSIFEED